jgi:hypothetical protein
MGWLLGCLGAQALVACVVPSPWWVPDLALVGLVLVIGATPERWLPAACLAGLFTGALAVRVPIPIAFGYVIGGWVLRTAGSRWDLGDRRVQCLAASGLSAVLTLGMLWLEDEWSLALVGLASVRVFLTALVILLVPRCRRLNT